jgi:serine/threonine protein kinase
VRRLTIEAGQVFGPYLLEEELPRSGGMGRVLRARHLESDRICALKIIRADLADRPRYRARFAREGKILRSLQHPNILPIFDSGEIEGIPFIDTQFVRGGDLRSFLGNPISTATALSIVEQAAAGLEAAHRAGIVHRDVKPGNLLVEREGEQLKVLVADFGVAWGGDFATAHTRHGEAIGTPGFMSPECLRGQEADKRADVYSLGCCLSWIVPPSTDRRALTEVIRRATAYDAEWRYPTVTALYEDVARALGGGDSQPLTAVRPEPQMEKTCFDTPTDSDSTADFGRRASVVDEALNKLGLRNLVKSSRLARGRSDPQLITAVLVADGVRRLKPHASPLAADIAEDLGCDRVRLVLLPTGQNLSETVRCYLSLIFAERVPSEDLDSITARRVDDLLEIDLRPRLYSLCDEDALVPLVAQLEVKRVRLNPTDPQPAMRK